MLRAMPNTDTWVHGSKNPARILDIGSPIKENKIDSTCQIIAKAITFQLKLLNKWMNKASNVLSILFLSSRCLVTTINNIEQCKGIVNSGL